jgi:hypothetical protein
VTDHLELELVPFIEPDLGMSFSFLDDRQMTG